MGLGTDLVAYWKLDANSSTQADATGNGYDGTVNGSAVYDSSGIINGCYSFPGTTSDYIETSYDFSGLTELSISGWFKQGTALQYPVGGKTEFNTPAIYPRQSDGLVGFTLAGTNLQVFGVSWTANTWVHFVLTYKSGETNGKKIYINGTKEAETTQTATISSTSNFCIGRRNNSAHTGYVDEVGIWERALTSTEVSTLYGSGSGYSADNFITPAAANYLKGRQRDRFLMFNVSEKVQ